MAVLPVPPFGEKTVMIRPSRLPPAAARRGACVALRIAKTTFSVSAGSSTTSATSAPSASSSSADASPDATSSSGTRVASRIAATSCAGSVDELVPWRTQSR